MNVLVTGGAGYIGAHFVRIIADQKGKIVVVDDLVGGLAERIPGIQIVRLELADSQSIDLLRSTIIENEIDTVVHFAARKDIEESVRRPAWYYQQNVGGLANLLLAIESTGVDKFLFSSTAAVYAPSTEPCSEVSPTGPAHAYGRSKLLGEEMLGWLADSSRFKSICLRYFNVAGAGSPELGDNSAHNLIPMVFERIFSGKQPVIFGTDYPTRDGSCIRDYVHVVDVANAHLAALEYLEASSGGSEIFNIGTGKGSTVLEVVDSISKVSGLDLTPKFGDRRPGDLSSIVASVEKANSILGWRAEFGLEDMVQSAWDAATVS
ncbi:MAG: UDP-glucose 4-epimerase GalE [Cryobacterium sp.]|nr:UDP-glucose 4-epimerase GalE [Cryobacterium sp.]MCO5294608.1 UDP-glucose 4-epimerase GalE [Homoserinimonas sp.]MCW5945021.1 UDP-glucose 4-epimerase GalE [Cryobacterium sp.]